ncbi:hypothetical protein NE237_000098 [Protea cynaroides]|uniref:Uncharacterized protein n=1 Tax=Protea cynaroides TaxID=273540 RepID=A0A9Q0JT55_9MAGN|nr:hypothetical protein NE237_000098 [Protea cynaroides]
MCAIGYERNIDAIKSEGMDNVGLLEVNPGFGMRILREDLHMPSLPKLILSSQTYMVESGDCEKVENLGDRAFFIDTTNFYCLSCLYIFDLELKNVSISLPCLDVDSHDFEVAWIIFAPTMSCSPSSDEGNMEEVMEVQQVLWSWADLPEELLSSKQSHLFVGHLICFQVPLPLDSLDYLMMATSPCLTSFSTKGYINMFYPMNNNTYILKLEEELFGALICFSKDGWLLLIELPDFPHDHGFDAFCFTSTTTSSDCIIIVLFLKNIRVVILMLGEKRWNIYNFNNKKIWRVFNGINKLCHFSPCHFFHLIESNTVFFGGLFYCLNEQRKLGYFDPKGGC